jgi:hypothetical protein
MNVYVGGYVGGDVSKGYADFCLMDEEGEILLEIQLDDTHRGPGTIITFGLDGRLTKAETKRQEDIDLPQ